ncbi:DgyrCDS2793 [Dimorphilus gyrociliatus]|uniref:Methionine--tRNA ligase, cytoplasmic n=1 Tax=Dimorphilus gyrociliatus TaxID=2664684 RepID=A0A7I8VE25_9ANNE|nr:DgyrCDS2793 [Dimorphilus gyrociliatus]
MSANSEIAAKAKTEDVEVVEAVVEDKITEQDIEEAVTFWTTDCPPIELERQHPIFCRLRTYNSLYICGTDEYGTASETKALKEKITEKELCDKYNALHREIYEWFNIDFDSFGRTTTEKHTEIAQSIFWEIYNNKNVIKDEMEQLFCPTCSKFLADRFVTGGCPFCKYEDARGDQCDGCGKLMNAVELINPKCSICKEAPQVKKTNHLFLDLPKLQDEVDKYLDESFDKGIWTSNAQSISKIWIRDGLKPRCISRDLKWGVTVPLEGYRDKVFYVWYDAPIGYISITANYTDEWEKWWKNPEKVQYVEFMAKDNVPFHSIIFPCTLLATEKSWTKVNSLSATEYLNYEGKKFSKSRGVGVFGDNAKETGVPADIFRFYLLYIRPEGRDTDFQWKDFQEKNNNELLNNLGNFVNRALNFVNKYFENKIPEIILNEEDKNLLAEINKSIHNYIDSLEHLRIRDGIKWIFNISRLGNQYIQSNEPWKKLKQSDDEKKRAASVVGLAANIVYQLATLLHPYMPSISKTIQTQLNASDSILTISEKIRCNLKEGHVIGKASPLFRKIEDAEAEEWRNKYGGEKETIDISNINVEQLKEDITKQGNVVRELKTAKAEKAKIDAEVQLLKDLKKKLTLATGEELQDKGKQKKSKSKKNQLINFGEKINKKLSNEYSNTNGIFNDLVKKMNNWTLIGILRMDPNGRIQLIDQTGKINVIITSMISSRKMKSHELNDCLNHLVIINSFYCFKEIEMYSEQMNELNYSLIFSREDIIFLNDNVNKIDFSGKNLINLMFTVLRKSVVTPEIKNIEIQVLFHNTECLCKKRSDLKDCRIIVESRTYSSYLDMNQIYELSIEKDNITVACDVIGLQFRHILFIKSKKGLNIECIGETENAINSIKYIQTEHSKKCTCSYCSSSSISLRGIITAKTSKIEVNTSNRLYFLELIDEENLDTVNVQYPSCLQQNFVVGSCIDLYNLEYVRNSNRVTIQFTLDSFNYIRYYVIDVKSHKNNILKNLETSYLCKRVQFPEDRSVFKFIGCIQKVDKIRLIFNSEQVDVQVYLRLLVQDGTAYSYIDINDADHLQLILKLRDTKWKMLLEKLKYYKIIEYNGSMDSSTEALAFLSLSAFAMEGQLFTFIAKVSQSHKNSLLSLKDGTPIYLIDLPKVGFNDKSQMFTLPNLSLKCLKLYNCDDE